MKKKCYENIYYANEYTDPMLPLIFNIVSYFFFNYFIIDIYFQKTLYAARCQNHMEVDFDMNEFVNG